MVDAIVVEEVCGAGTEPNADTGVAAVAVVAVVPVVVAALPNIELLTAGAFEPNGEAEGGRLLVLAQGLFRLELGIVLVDSALTVEELLLFEPNKPDSDFTFVFSSSFSPLALAVTAGSFPFKEAAIKGSGSRFRSVVKAILGGATCANGDSDCVVFAYSVKGGSLTRYFGFLMSLCGSGFSDVLVGRVGDLSSGKVSAGSTLLLSESLNL